MLITQSTSAIGNYFTIIQSLFVFRKRLNICGGQNNFSQMCSIHKVFTVVIQDSEPRGSSIP